MEKIKSHYKIILLIIATIIGFAIFLYLYLNNFASGSVFNKKAVEPISTIDDKKIIEKDDFGQVAGETEDKENIEKQPDQIKSEKTTKKIIPKTTETQENSSDSNYSDTSNNQNNDDSTPQPSPSYSLPPTPLESPLPFPTILD